MSKIRRIGNILNGSEVEREGAALFMHDGEPLTLRRAGSSPVPPLLDEMAALWLASSRPVFDEADVVRMRAVVRLQAEMAVNPLTIVRVLSSEEAG
jgi:hypothetical protein